MIWLIDLFDWLIDWLNRCSCRKFCSETSPDVSLVTTGKKSEPWDRIPACHEVGFIVRVSTQISVSWPKPRKPPKPWPYLSPQVRAPRRRTTLCCLYQCNRHSYTEWSAVMVKEGSCCLSRHFLTSNPCWTILTNNRKRAKRKGQKKSMNNNWHFYLYKIGRKRLKIELVYFICSVFNVYTVCTVEPLKILPQLLPDTAFFRPPSEVGLYRPIACTACVLYFITKFLYHLYSRIDG